MTTTPYTSLLTGLAFPEGPAFAPDGSLWLVELQGGSLVRYRNEQGRRYAVGGAPNGIAIDRGGEIWFCDSAQNAIRRFDPLTEQTQTWIASIAGLPLAKPNDLAFDGQGNLVFTCPGESRREPTGYVCAGRPDGTVERVANGLYYPNGLALTPDGRQLIIAETYRHRLWIGDWNPSACIWTQARVWANVPGPDGPGGPDGMAFDKVGNLHVAVYGTGRVWRIGSSGNLLDCLPTPGPNPTNCAFDPSGQLGLVVTEAGRGNLLSLPAPG